jgi:hypothetical protein
MNPLALLPYVLGAYGGYQGYRGAKESGASGLSSLLRGALGAYTGYSLGQVGGFAQNAGFQAPSFLQNMPGITKAQALQQGATTPSMSPMEMARQGITKSTGQMVDKSSILDIF